MREFENSIAHDDDLAINEFVQKGSSIANKPLEERDPHKEEEEKKNTQKRKDDEDSEKDSALGSEGVKEEETFDDNDDRKKITMSIVEEMKNLQ